MNPLELQKQLLIAESELNRAQLAQEWQAMTDEVHALTKQARTASCLALSAFSLIRGLSALRGKKSAGAAGKSSWLQTLLKCVGLAATLWQSFRPSHPPQPDTN